MMYFIYFSTLAIVLFAPVCLYRRRSRFIARFCIMMRCSDNFMKFYCYMLLLAVIGIHSITFNTKPLDYGLMFSSVLMILMFNTRWSRKVIELLNTDIRYLYGIMVLAMLVSFVPHMLTIGITLAIVLIGICFWPSEEFTSREKQIMIRDYNIACRRNDYRDFIDTYFQWKKRTTELPKMEVIIGKQNQNASAALIEEADAEELT